MDYTHFSRSYWIQKQDIWHTFTGETRNNKNTHSTLTMQGKAAPSSTEKYQTNDWKHIRNTCSYDPLQMTESWVLECKFPSSVAPVVLHSQRSSYVNATLTFCSFLLYPTDLKKIEICSVLMWPLRGCTGEWGERLAGWWGSAEGGSLVLAAKILGH